MTFLELIHINSMKWKDTPVKLTISPGSRLHMPIETSEKKGAKRSLKDINA